MVVFLRICRLVRRADVVALAALSATLPPGFGLALRAGFFPGAMAVSARCALRGLRRPRLFAVRIARAVAVDDGFLDWTLVAVIALAAGPLMRALTLMRTLTLM